MAHRNMPRSAHHADECCSHHDQRDAHHGSRPFIRPVQTDAEPPDRQKQSLQLATCNHASIPTARPSTTVGSTPLGSGSTGQRATTFTRCPAVLTFKAMPSPTALRAAADASAPPPAATAARAAADAASWQPMDTPTRRANESNSNATTMTAGSTVANSAVTEPRSSGACGNGTARGARPINSSGGRRAR